MNTIICKQLEKYKDKNGKIIGYRLVDQAGVQTQMKADDLKAGIKAGSLEVINLTLTQDGRLVDGAEPQIKDEELKRASNIVAAIESISVDSLQKDELKALEKILDDKLKEVRMHAYKFSAFGINLDFDVPDFAVVSKDQKLVTEYLYENKYIPNSDKYVLRSVLLLPNSRETNIIAMLNDGSSQERDCYGRPSELIICWLMKNSLYGLTPKQTEKDVMDKITDKNWMRNLKIRNPGLNNVIFDAKTYKK